MAELFGLQPRAVGRDLSPVGVVATLLVLVHVALPPAMRTRLANDHADLDVPSLFTSAYVHLDTAHLLGNLAGFLTAALVAYGLCVRMGRRRWFRVTVVALVVVLPPLVSATSFLLLGRLHAGLAPVSRGFSGVGAGFAGFVLVALGRFVGTRHGAAMGRYLWVAVWTGLLLEVSVIYGTDLLVVAVALAAATWGLVTVAVLAEYRVQSVRRRLRRARADVLVTVVVVALLALLVVVLFPANVVRDNAVTNVVAHAAGFCFGVGLTVASTALVEGDLVRT
jgi:hypothetical protein